MTTLLDTNIVIFLLAEETPENKLIREWAIGKFEERKAEGPVIISDIVYCEVSVAMESQAQMDEAVSRLGIDRIPCSDAALFRAGRAFKKYKEENKGPKTGVLPDYIIGAVAEAEGLPLLTTNPRDYTGYFPGLTIIKPETVSVAGIGAALAQAAAGVPAAS